MEAIFLSGRFHDCPLKMNRLLKKAEFWGKINLSEGAIIGNFLNPVAKKKPS